MYNKKNRIIKNCKVCNTSFDIQKSKENRVFTCSKECQNKNKSNQRIGKKHNIKPRYKNCERCGNQWQLNDEKKRYRNKYCSSKCQNDAQSERLKGEKSVFWKGGIYNTNKRSKYSREIYKWRNAVLKRDNYNCKHCNSNINLEAHHIIPWSVSIEKRFDIDNGITLCICCHGKVHGLDFKNMRKKTRELLVNKCIDCESVIFKSSTRCVKCYYIARKKKIIVNRVKAHAKPEIIDSRTSY